MICGEGVPEGDAVDLLVDYTDPELQRDQPTVVLDALSMGMSDDFPVAVEKGTHSVCISRAIFGHLA